MLTQKGKFLLSPHEEGKTWKCGPSFKKIRKKKTVKKKFEFSQKEIEGTPQKKRGSPLGLLQDALNRVLSMERDRFVREDF